MRISKVQLEAILDQLRIGACTYLKKLATTMQEAAYEVKARFMRQLLGMLGWDLPMRMRKIALGAMEVLMFRRDSENQLRAGLFELVRQQLAQSDNPLNLTQCECLALCGQLLMHMRYDQLTYNHIDSMLEGYF